MKICLNCQCASDDVAKHCQKCGEKFEVGKPIAPTEQGDLEFNVSISDSRKWHYWFGAWVLTALVTLVINPSSILGAPFFPIGLLVWLPKGESRAITGWMSGDWIIGWIFYAVLSFIMLTEKKSRVFFIMFAIFSVLLGLNVVGCQRVIQAASGIH